MVQGPCCGARGELGVGDKTYRSVPRVGAQTSPPPALGNTHTHTDTVESISPLRAPTWILELDSEAPLRP